MTSGITLSAGVRSNLLSLQNTASLMATTQNRLATGKKVNSALDNPLNFFTSSSLSARASDLSGLLDNMSNGIQTIQTANNGLTAITGLIQQLQATVAQARSDASAGTVSATPGTAAVSGTDAGANTSTQTNNALTFNIGSGVTVSVATQTHTNATVSTVTGTGAPVGTDATGATLTVDDGSGSGPQTVTFATGDITTAAKITAINTQLTAAGSTVSASLDSAGKVVFTNSTGKAETVTASAAIQTDLGLAATATSTDGAVATDHALTLTELADSINNNTQLAGKVSATLNKNASGTVTGLTFNNLSTTTNVSVTGFDGTNLTGAAADTTTINKGTGGTISNVRQSLLNQFNSLLTQINTTAADSGYNGINLLNGDSLKLSFNESGSSSVDIQTRDANGNSIAINATNLGITSQTAADFGNNTTLDNLSSTLSDSLTSLRTQASALGSSLSVVQTRKDFTNSMINSLQTGADNLVLADANQEGANLLALQTRQSLSTTALSLSSQADQAVLQLFQ
ncbi:MAG: flagellar protein [Rhodopseudomonas sp.]|nr:flagellar protein [Rhodopseudomonas sp.]